MGNRVQYAKKQIGKLVCAEYENVAYYIQDRELINLGFKNSQSVPRILRHSCCHVVIPSPLRLNFCHVVIPSSLSHSCCHVVIPLSLRHSCCHVVISSSLHHSFYHMLNQPCDFEIIFMGKDFKF